MIVDGDRNGNGTSGAGAPRGNHEEGEADGLEDSVDEGQKERSKRRVVASSGRCGIDESEQRNPDDRGEERATGVKQGRCVRSRGHGAAITIPLERQLASKVIDRLAWMDDGWVTCDAARACTR